MIFHATLRRRRRASSSSTRARRAVSFIEVMFSVAIMGFVLAAMSSAFLAVLQVERKNTIVMDMGMDALEFQRVLQRYAASAQQIVAPDGLSARITNPNGVVTVIRYRDDDGNPRTIGDNSIELIPDISLGESGKIVVTRVTPPNLVGPIFRKDTMVGYSPLIIEFVVGDYPRQFGTRCDAITGPGYQSFTFRARISPRNSG